MVLMLVNLQGAAVIFRLGRHHHRGPFCEGRGLTHALTDTAPTDLTVATHSPLGAQPQSDRILLLPCGRLAPAAPYTVALDALKHASRSSSLQATSRPLFYEPRVCVCDAPRGLGMRGEGERGDAGGWRAGGSLGRHTVRGAEGYTTSAGGRMRTDS